MTGAIPRLFIFPHAGGSPQDYKPFANSFSNGVKRIAVQYPGKRTTHDLASFTGIEDLAGQVVAKLDAADQWGDKMAFFGHSMGGLVAFEVARRLEDEGRPIAALFVSAVAAPGHTGYDDIPESDQGLLDAATAMTGVDREFLQNEEFAAQILPTLRGFKAIVKYRCPPGVTVSCPIFAYLGDSDEVATPEKVAPWAERTTSEFDKRMFPGHHFYFNEHLPTLVNEIESRLTTWC